MNNPETGPTPARASSLKQRLRTAGVLILVFVAFFLFAPVWLLCLVAVLVTLLASWEYLEMTDKGQGRADRILCLSLAVLFPLAAWTGGRECLYGTVFLAVLLLSFRSVLSRADLQTRFSDLQRRLYGTLLVGFSISHFLLLTEVEGRGVWIFEGWRLWILALLVVIYVGDGAAYFAGSYLGRRRLAERLSPKKTWEGAAGGLAGSVVSMFLCRWLFLPPLTVAEALLLSVVVAVCGQMGDLVESLVKRTCEVKDSGNILPGHGGILDRIDSVLFAVPTGYYLLRLL